MLEQQKPAGNTFEKSSIFWLKHRRWEQQEGLNEEDADAASDAS